jgi:predicted Rossmann fold flavoprotein
VILERGGDVLEKVRISGGGRCNVTNVISEPKELVKHYPRGKKEMLGPFFRFSSDQTRSWFEAHGVETKEESDGRVFPVTNDSETIVSCLMQAALDNNVEIRTRARVEQLIPPGEDPFWKVIIGGGETLSGKNILFTPGGSTAAWKIVESLGHTVITPVPSLFTFNIRDPRIEDLEGISVPKTIVSTEGISTEGPLLITHWGMSGPAILRLSAWGARAIADKQYKFTVTVNWTGLSTYKEVFNVLNENREKWARSQVCTHPFFSIPSRLWRRFTDSIPIAQNGRWADLRKEQMEALASILFESRFDVDGKSTFKEEFVTAGGVELSEVDFRTFRSKKHPTLYFAGEVLDIDAITGGFNFQAAWTGGYLAGCAIGESL